MTATTTTPTRTSRLVALSLSQQDAQHWTSVELQDAVRTAKEGFALATEQGDYDGRGFWSEVATNARELLRDRGDTTSTTTAVVPVCPSWCTSHLFAAMDDTPRTC